MTRLREFDALPEKLSLEEALAAAGACLHSALAGGASAVSDITRHLNEGRGKGIRMRLLLAAALDDNNEVPRDAVRGAAAVELFHLATLVHDDVIDDAPLRRGVETVQSKFGKKAAVISGDYLLCLAMSVMAPLHTRLNETYMALIPTFSNLLMNVCLGEYRQHINQGNYELGVYDYLKTISGKTAALFTVSAYLGAVLGEDKQSKTIARFGNYVGMIFQIMDDCKDYEFSEAAALKTVRHDAADGVVTLPLILALAKSPSLARLAADTMAGASADALVREVCRLGGTADAKAVAKRYGEKAERTINTLGSEFKKQRLRELLRQSLGVEA